MGDFSVDDPPKRLLERRSTLSKSFFASTSRSFEPRRLNWHSAMIESYRTRSVSRLQTKQEGFTLRRSRAASFAGCGERQKTKRGHLDVSREPRCACDGIAASILIEIKAPIDWLQELSGWPHLRVHDEPTDGDRQAANRPSEF